MKKHIFLVLLGLCSGFTLFAQQELDSVDGQPIIVTIRIGEAYQPDVNLHLPKPESFFTALVGDTVHGRFTGVVDIVLIPESRLDTFVTSYQSTHTALALNQMNFLQEFFCGSLTDTIASKFDCHTFLSIGDVYTMPMCIYGVRHTMIGPSSEKTFMRMPQLTCDIPSQEKIAIVLLRK